MTLPAKRGRAEEIQDLQNAAVRCADWRPKDQGAQGSKKTRFRNVPETQPEAPRGKPSQSAVDTEAAESKTPTTTDDRRRPGRPCGRIPLAEAPAGGEEVAG